MDTLLSVEGVTVSFDGFTVLDGLDFSVNSGELRFLIGPNGAGKTTLLDVITGSVRPRSGRVLFAGVDVSSWAEHRRARRGIGRKFQTAAVFPTLTAYQNVEAAFGCTGSTAALFGTLTRLDRERIDAVLDRVGLSERAATRAGVLSHGEMQWLEIGMLMIGEPRLLLLDEPIAGMTRGERDHTGELLESLTKDHAVVVVEHDMEFIRQFARTVTVMHLGKVLVEGPVAMVQEHPGVREIYLGPTRDRAAA